MLVVHRLDLSSFLGLVVRGVQISNVSLLFELITIHRFHLEDLKIEFQISVYISALVVVSDFVDMFERLVVCWCWLENFLYLCCFSVVGYSSRHPLFKMVFLLRGS